MLLFGNANKNNNHFIIAVKMFPFACDKHNVEHAISNSWNGLLKPDINLLISLVQIFINICCIPTATEQYIQFMILKNDDTSHFIIFFSKFQFVFQLFLFTHKLFAIFYDDDFLAVKNTNTDQLEKMHFQWRKIPIDCTENNFNKMSLGFFFWAICFCRMKLK